MSYSKPHRYVLYCTAGGWSDDYASKIGYIYMSAMPDKDQILKILRDNEQLDNLNQDYIDNILIDRPLGWYYKQIRVCAYNDTRNCVWKIDPAP
jgi:hypothetical protein